jgi:hypothetical protein
MKTPHDLACAISALINSTPRSPSVAELDAVIGEHWQAASGGGVPVKARGLAEVSLDDRQELAQEILKILNGHPPHDLPGVASVAACDTVSPGAGGMNCADVAPSPLSGVWKSKFYPYRGRGDAQ